MDIKAPELEENVQSPGEVEAEWSVRLLCATRSHFARSQVHRRYFS